MFFNSSKISFSAAPDQCCFGKGEYGGNVSSSQQVPEFCAAICKQLSLPHIAYNPPSIDWAKQGICVEYKDTVDYCLQKYGAECIVAYRFAISSLTPA